MATMTAQILAGEEHPKRGGIKPTQNLFLSENNRPAWISYSRLSSSWTATTTMEGPLY